MFLIPLIISVPLVSLTTKIYDMDQRCLKSDIREINATKFKNFENSEFIVTYIKKVNSSDSSLIFLNTEYLVSVYSNLTRKSNSTQLVHQSYNTSDDTPQLSKNATANANSSLIAHPFITLNRIAKVVANVTVLFGRGVGAGIMSSLMGVLSTFRHPINSIKNVSNVFIHPLLSFKGLIHQIQNDTGKYGIAYTLGKDIMSFGTFLLPMGSSIGIVRDLAIGSEVADMVNVASGFSNVFD